MLGVYGRLAAAGFRRQSQYRLAMIAGLITNVVFGFLRAAVLLTAVDAAGGELGGYSRTQLATYIWLSQGLLGAIGLWGVGVLSARIRTGDIAVDFTRPVDLQGWYLSEELGRAGYALVLRGAPAIAVGLLTTGMVLPAAVGPWVLGAVSIVFAVTLNFCCTLVIDAVAFWVIETRGMFNLYVVVRSFLVGVFVPIHLLPGWLQSVAWSTPFPSVMQTPVDVLAGRTTGAAAVANVAVQAGWIVAVGVLGHLLMRAGRHRLEVQGG
ncbi:MAG: ABC transporter permease [Desertimonas sp.]